MDFFSDDTNSTECDICGQDPGQTVGQGSYNEVTGFWSFYLCPTCAAAEAARMAAKDSAEAARQNAAIAMHATMS